MSAKGLVFRVVMMDVPAKKEHFDLFPIPMDRLPAHIITPHTIYLAELFKIVKGQIREIEALMFNTTLGARSGWPDKKWRSCWSASRLNNDFFGECF